MRPFASRLGALAVLVYLFMAACPASSQVIAHPNQIRGTLTITNTNPEIVALLASSGIQRVSVRASTTRLPDLDAESVGIIDDPMHAHYELTAEGFEPGMPYEVRLTPIIQGFGRGITAVSAPVEPEPAADVVLDFEQCVGVIMVNLVDLEGEPILDSNATVNGRRPPAGSSEMAFIVAQGTTVSFWVRIDTGTDPMHDTVRLLYYAGQATATCDEVTRFDCVIDPNPCDDEGDGIPMGRIVGNIDVVGAELVASGGPATYADATTRISAELGPFGNQRWDLLNTATRLRGPFELENLVSSSVSDPDSNYLIQSSVKVAIDGAVQTLELPRISVTVPDDDTLDLGDALVVRPSRLQAQVFVAGPPPSAARGRPMIADAAPNGVTWRVSGTSAIASGATRASVGLYGQVASVDAGYDDASSALSAMPALLSGGLDGAGAVQSFGTLNLGFSHEDDPTITEDWYDASAGFTNPDFENRDVQPGEVVDVPFRTCVGQVLIGIRSTGAPFYRPEIVALGEAPEIDFEGRRLPGRRSGRGSGLPQDIAQASTLGSVKLALAEGDYSLDTYLTFINPGGGVSNADLPPIPLHVGCRQVLTGTPQLVAQMTRAPSCIGSSPVTVSGSVYAEEEVASLTWSVNGGPETDACRPCGMLPSYSVEVPGIGGDMAILVKAIDALGREATVTHHARFADEPSALDREPGATPLRLGRSGNDMLLTWGAAAGTGHALYRGSIASLHAGRYDHAASGACSLASPQWGGPMPRDDSYFLVTASCGFGDASLGRDSFGRERPGAGPRCP